MALGLLFLCFPNFAATPVETSNKSFQQIIQELVKAPELLATEQEIRSIELDFESRDLVLQPTVELNGQRTNENRQLLFSFASNKPRFDTVAMKLRKPFSTGTAVEIGPSWERALTPTLDPDHRSTVDWRVTLSQSLWQDGFGRSTRLRRERENYERQRELAAALGRRGEVLLGFETVFWDWAVALREAELQEKNLKRSREILRWVQDRFQRSAAESTDLLQARALLTKRELQVAAIEQSLTQVNGRIERYFPGVQWRPQTADLLQERNLESLLSSWRGSQLEQITQLAFIQADNNAKAEERKAREVRESIRPRLNLQLAYGKNAVDPETNEAVQRSIDEQHEFSSVGIVFSTGLDLGLERTKVESARAARNAANLRREASAAEGRIAWDLLKEEIKNLRDRIARAKELVDLQIRNANAERDRYRKGRTTAFQAITFEQDAAESEILLVQLYGQLRKTEARARLFAR